MAGCRAGQRLGPVTHARRLDQEPTPRTLPLDDPQATDPAVVGVKAANLARAAAAGLPVLAGFVITTAAGAALEGATCSSGLDAELRAAWRRLSADGRRRLVVRSSSVAEDGEVASMAGQFVSVLGVVGWSGFRAAIGQVLASARTGQTPEDGSPAGAGRVAPMAVLVQPELEPAAAGVLFGVDPVSGRADRLLVAAVAGSPEPLVAGRVTGTRYVLSRGGRRLETDGEGPLGRRQLRSLARLAARARAVFGGPQDIEWAVDRTGRWWLLQNRPVTATAARPARGSRLLGPGPVGLRQAPGRRYGLLPAARTSSGAARHLQPPAVLPDSRPPAWSACPRRATVATGQRSLVPTASVAARWAKCNEPEPAPWSPNMGRSRISSY
jgi:hypothetical protein